MIACGRCGRENLDRYKFCLGCGVELARDSRVPAASSPSGLAPAVVAQAPATPAAKAPAFSTPRGIPVSALDIRSPFEADVAPKGVDPFLSTSPGSAAPAARSGFEPAAEPLRLCSTCGARIQPGFAFCGSCGAKTVVSAGAGTPAPQKTMFFGGAKAVVAPSATPKGRLILIRPDGSEGGSHALYDGENLIGRGAGLLFDGDAYLSPRHATLTFGPGGAVVEDLGSLNGVFLKLTQEEEMVSGDVFRIGQELIRLDAIAEAKPLEDGTEIMGGPSPGYWGRLSMILAPEIDGASYPLLAADVVLGRERGDILFADDGYVSGQHCRISTRGGRFYLADLGSSNGTFLRIREARVIPRGRFVLMGQQLFRLEYN